MELIGRVTANATVNTTKEGRKVVHFSIAINDSYKPKDSGEWKKVTTYVNCSYWISEAIAKHITKGVLVEVYGRISVSAWTNEQGEPKESLNFNPSEARLEEQRSTITMHIYFLNGANMAKQGKILKTISHFLYRRSDTWETILVYIVG
jgi:single-strand DNA-binding protein